MNEPLISTPMKSESLGDSPSPPRRQGPPGTSIRQRSTPQRTLTDRFMSLSFVQTGVPVNCPACRFAPIDSIMDFELSIAYDARKGELKKVFAAHEERAEIHRRGNDLERRKHERGEQVIPF